MNGKARSFAISLAAIPAFFAAGVAWMATALRFFESHSGRHRPDLIGTNHTPNYDFIYYPGGRGIEFWSLDAPFFGFVALSLILVAWCFWQRHVLGWWRVTGIAAYSILFGLCLLAAWFYFYFTAVSIFI